MKLRTIQYAVKSEGKNAQENLPAQYVLSFTTLKIKLREKVLMPARKNNIQK